MKSFNKMEQETCIFKWNFIDFFPPWSFCIQSTDINFSLIFIAFDCYFPIYSRRLHNKKRFTVKSLSKRIPTEQKAISINRNGFELFLTFFIELRTLSIHDLFNYQKYVSLTMKENTSKADEQQCRRKNGKNSPTCNIFHYCWHTSGRVAQHSFFPLRYFLLRRWTHSTRKWCFDQQNIFCK